LRILFFETHDVYTHGLPQALGRFGHTVDVWQGPPTGERLERYLATRRPELVLTMGWTPMHGDPAVRAALRRYGRDPGTLHVYWATEDPIHTDVWTLPYVEAVEPDAVVTLSPRSLPRLRRRGFPAMEMPFAADPEFHAPRAGGPRADVVLVGTAYAETGGILRKMALAWLLRPLLGLGLDVAVWGGLWNSSAQTLGFSLPPEWLRGVARYEDVPAIYSGAAVILCPQNDPDQLTGRTFEALGTGGGVVLTPRTPGVLRLFEEGRHLLCTASEAETLRALRRALGDAPARAALAQAARAEVLARHTYDARAQVLLTWVEEWRRAKRCGGRVPSGSPLTEVAVRAAEDGIWTESGELVLSFELPPVPVGRRLLSATLECFADTVRHPGEAACLLRPAGLLLDAVRVADRGEDPYPYAAGWRRWDVTAAVQRAAGPRIELAVRPQSGLDVVWAQPGVKPRSWLMQHHLPAFCPRLVLVWADG
jgi:spore maturation protein CgeB